MWVYPEQFDNTVLCLGGMHTLKSFIGSICSLMAESGICELLDSTLAGVQKMMTGKKFYTKYEGIEDCSRRTFKANFDRWHSTSYAWS